MYYDYQQTLFGFIHMQSQCAFESNRDVSMQGNRLPLKK